MSERPAINYNVCNYDHGLPVTIRFANKVGDVLTMGSVCDAERQPLKFYVSLNLPARDHENVLGNR